MKNILIHSNNTFDLYFLGLDFSKGYPRIRLKVCTKGLFDGNKRNQHYKLRQESKSSFYYILVYGEKIELSKSVCSMIDTTKLYVMVLNEEHQRRKDGDDE